MEYFFSGIVFYCVQHDNFDLNCFEDSFLQIHSGSSNLTLLITNKKNTEIFICFFMRWELFKMNKSKQDLGSICRSKYWPTQIFFSANPFFFFQNFLGYLHFNIFATYHFLEKNKTNMLNKRCDNWTFFINHIN